MTYKFILNPSIKYNINVKDENSRYNIVYNSSSKYNIFLKSSIGPKGEKGDRGQQGENGRNSISQQDVLQIISETIIDGGNF